MSALDAPDLCDTKSAVRAVKNHDEGEGAPPRMTLYGKMRTRVLTHAQESNSSANECASALGERCNNAMIALLENETRRSEIQNSMS